MHKMMTVDTTSLDGMTFDGGDLWVSDVEERMLKKVSIAQQSVLKEIKFLPGGIPRCMTFVNDSLVVVNFNPQTETSTELIQINVMNGKTLRTLDCPDNIDGGIVFDNSYFWATSIKDAQLIKFDPSNGEVVATFDLETPACAIAFDGNNLVLALAKVGRKKTSGIAIFDPELGKIVGQEKIDADIPGVAFAENMIFYNHKKNKEIMVTRVKIDS